MVSIKCNECGKTKKSSMFYPGTGHICKECKIAYSTKRTKEVKGITINLLTEILEKQNLLLDNQEIILERISALERDVNKTRKILKKTL